MRAARQLAQVRARSNCPNHLGRNSAAQKSHCRVVAVWVFGPRAVDQARFKMA
jgi:hypothetical protein